MRLVFPSVATLRSRRQAGQPCRRLARHRLLPLLLALALAAWAPLQAAAARLAPDPENSSKSTSSDSSGSMSAQQAAAAAVRPIKAVIRGQKMMVRPLCSRKCTCCFSAAFTRRRLARRRMQGLLRSLDWHIPARAAATAHARLACLASRPAYALLHPVATGGRGRTHLQDPGHPRAEESGPLPYAGAPPAPLTGCAALPPGRAAFLDASTAGRPALHASATAPGRAMLYEDEH